MKTKFIGPIRDNLPKGKVLLFGDSDANPTDFKGILPSAEGIDFVGNEFRIPLKSARNNAVGFRSENETLPAPNSSKYTYLQEPMRYGYAVFNITGQLLKAAESGEGAFRPAFKAEVEDTTLASKLDINRAAHGDGSGKLAVITAEAASEATEVALESTINFRGGEIIDFVTAAGVVVSPAHEVTAVNRSTRKITVSPKLAAAVATSRFPVRASSDSTIAVPNNSQNKEIQGLESIVSSTGTLHGISPTTYSWWKSYENTTGGAINDDLIHLGKDEVGFEQGLDIDNGLDFVLVGTRGLRRRYAATLTSLKRFAAADKVSLNGGYSALMFDDVNPFFVDDQCKLGTLYGLALNRLFWSQMSDWSWMEEDGKVMKWEPRKDRYISVLYKYCQLGTTHRGAHFKLTGLTDDVK